MIIKTYELQKLKSINLNMFLLYGVNEGFKKQVIKDYFIKDFDGVVQKYEELEVLNNYENNQCSMDVFFALSHGVHRGILKKGKFLKK